jgi:alkane 1-monooxygenase
LTHAFALEISPHLAQHVCMIAGLVGLAFLGAFALLPLYWVGIGAPWISLAIAFVAIPAVDAVVGAPRPAAERAAPPPFVRWIPRAQLVFQTILLIEAARLAATLPLADLVVFAIAVGTVTGGLGITIAHELGHRASRLDRLIARALLVSVCYGHFFVEHVRGHHVRVATPEDPATAPRGMSVYRFFLRSLVGFVHAWRLEAMRLQGRGQPAWHPSNWVLTGTALSIAMLIVGGLLAGPNAVLLLALQSIWAVMLLETINYIEHYGLQRRAVNGRYEPVRLEHSWNANFVVSNWVLFNLQLHSDHHAHMERPFEELQTAPSAPQLPAGYGTMVLLAWLPPAWFAVMNPRLPASA